MSVTDSPDWQRQVVINNAISATIPVTIINTNPQSPSLYWDPLNNTAHVTNADTVIIDASAYFATVVGIGISVPSGGQGVWVAYGVAASLNHGIYVPSPGFLWEDQYFGPMHGIVASGAQDVGVLVMQHL